ncbi:MAG TPA: hypothetical protein DGT23_15080 [Micromonosporaceae bacterium]|nr:hypothetical protein [Micromonosporaceae bacterium]
MDLVVSAVVMAHPRRLEAATALRDRHPELDMSIVTDPDPDGPPDALRTARRAWRSVPDHATHLLIVQDDMLLVDDIKDQVYAAAEAMPGQVLCFFTEWGSRSSHALRLATVEGADWVPVIDPYIPTAAHMLPAGIARRLADYAGEVPDDVLLLHFAKQEGMTPYISVPNLAQHTPVTSLMGNDLIQGPRPAAWWASPQGLLGSKVSKQSVIPHLLIFEGYSVCWVDGQFIRTHNFLDQRFGIDLRQQLEWFVEAMVEVDPAGLIRDVVAEPLLLQFWLTVLAYGAVAGVAPHEEALRTLAPGSLRRFVPFSVLDKLPELVNPVAHQAIKLGSSIGKNPSNYM